MTGPIEVLLYRDRDGILTARVRRNEDGEQRTRWTNNWRIRDVVRAIEAALAAEPEQ